MLHEESGGKSYMYYWEQESGLKYMGACHAVELAYVFANPQCNIYTGDVFNEELSRKVGDAWAALARTGDPSTEELSWPAYDGKSRLTMCFSGECTVKGDIKAEERKLLEPLMWYRFNGNYSNLDYKVPYVGKKIFEAAVLAGLSGLAIYAVVKLLRKK